MRILRKTKTGHQEETDENELLTIGPFTVYGYGLMIAIGIVAGCLTAEYRARKQGLDSEQIFPMVLWCLVGGFLCAKLLFWITEWKSIIQDPGFMMETLSSVLWCLEESSAGY